MSTATLTHSDPEIQTDAMAELRWDPSVPATEIGDTLARNAQVDAERITVEAQRVRWRPGDEQHVDTGD